MSILSYVKRPRLFRILISVQLGVTHLRAVHILMHHLPDLAFERWRALDLTAEHVCLQLHHRIVLELLRTTRQRAVREMKRFTNESTSLIKRLLRIMHTRQHQRIFHAKDTHQYPEPTCTVQIPANIRWRACGKPFAPINRITARCSSKSGKKSLCKLPII